MKLPPFGEMYSFYFYPEDRNIQLSCTTRHGDTKHDTSTVTLAGTSNQANFTSEWLWAGCKIRDVLIAGFGFQGCESTVGEPTPKPR